MYFSELWNLYLKILLNNLIFKNMFFLVEFKVNNLYLLLAYKENIKIMGFYIISF